MIKIIILFIVFSLSTINICYSFEFNSDIFLEDVKNKASNFSNYTQEKFKDIKYGVTEYFHDSNSKEEDKKFNDTWKKFSDLSNDAIELAIKNNPNEKTTFEFVTLQEPKYVRLIKEAQQILSNSEANQQFEDIEKLRIINKDIKNKINDLRRKRISSPDSSLNPLTDTRKSIDKKIIDLTNEIKNNENQISNLKSEIINLLNSHGIKINSEELNYFIVSAEGNDVIRLITIADNMKRIQKIIENELKSDNNIDLARIYTGMYLVSLDAYANAHDSVINNIYKYRSRLSDIKQETYNSYEEAKRLSRESSDQDLTNVNSNIKINEKAIEVADTYDKILDRRTNNLRESKSNLEKKLKIARNTYKTIVNAASLINLVNDGSDEYMLIINFEMPELKNMYDDTFMTAFSDISDRIKMEK